MPFDLKTAISVGTNSDFKKGVINALYKKGELVTVAVNEVIKTVTICRILSNGYLEIETEKGIKQSHALGAIQWLS